MRSLLVVLCCAVGLTAQVRQLPQPLYGVTLDDVSNLSGIVNSLSNLPHFPISRVVFDENTSPSDYTKAIQTLYPYTYLMGEILDSAYVKAISVSAYQARATKFVQAFGNQVDLWEIGNEVNGEWLGRTADVVAKINAAYTVVSNAGKSTELTLYYNPNCWSNRANAMIPWATNNLSPTLRASLNYVMVSYYEGDCNNYRPSATEWTNVFSQLHNLFPNAFLGFGETGLANPVGSNNLSKATGIMQYYYGLRPSVPGYVLGGFWWYGAEDLVPSSKPMWGTLQKMMLAPW